MNSLRRRGLCAVAIALELSLGHFASAQSPRVDVPAKPTRAPALLDRVAILGASVSHGFRNATPLTAVFQHALAANRADPKSKDGPSLSTVFDHTEGNMFVDPQGLTERAIDRCIEERATLVVGVDVLFWFGYGIALDGKDDLERRTKRLAYGLELLERIQCPLVIGDLPDVRNATSKLLAPPAIPSADVLAKLNEAIRAWAKPRANVTIVPLSAWVAALSAGTWTIPPPAGSKAKAEILSAADALQADRLHPTDMGAHALAHALIASIRNQFGARADALVFDGYAEARRRGVWPPPPPAPVRKP